jgi:hypothetical protein
MKKSIYRVVEPIPEIHAEPGDYVILRPGDPISPVEVLKRFDQSALIGLKRGESRRRVQLINGEPVLRPVEVVSDSIRASSDDAAISELLKQVGGL